MLLKINERKRWIDPPPADNKDKIAEQDEEIFQTARLVKWDLLLFLYLWVVFIDADNHEFLI